MFDVCLMGLFGKSKKKDESLEQLKSLFDKFEYTDLEKFCESVIGRKPGSIDKERITKVEVLDYVWGQYHDGKFNFDQAKDFAIKQAIVSQDFFD